MHYGLAPPPHPLLPTVLSRRHRAPPHADRSASDMRPGHPVVVGPQSPLGSPPPMPLSGMHATEIRGVGIKFGERLEPASGGIKVYVKRLVNDSPAHRCGLISPGDVLVLIDGEDVFGWGLAWLRNKIPGPAGSWVRLGFRGHGGRLYEVPLCRTAYGSTASKVLL